MQRLTTSWLALGVLVAVSSVEVSCGAPAELDESLFPGPNEVGYADGTGSTGTPLGGGGASGQGPSAGAGSPSVGNGGSAGSAPAAPGGDGGSSALPSAGGSTPVAAGGSAQSGAAGGGSAPMSGGSAGGGCPDDIAVLFDRPITEGGCAGDACHVAGGTAPDLVSPNVEARLLNVISQCNGRPYIGAGDSFLADKIAGSPPECGLAMPFFMPNALSAADEQCILDWIDEVSGG